jgi:adenylate cyclase
LVLRGAASLAASKGRVDEAVGIYKRILDLDPLNWLAYNNLGCTLYDAGRFREAEVTLRKLLELASQYEGARATLSLVLLAQGHKEEALAHAKKETSGWSRHWAMAIIYDAMGSHLQSDQALQELIAGYREAAAYQIAEVYGFRGEIDAAFEWLERAYLLRDGGLASIRTCWHFRSLHSDPRWDAFLKKMGFED